ncbi:SurA N-terminal domain-containing protein [Rhodovulum adriaticum]|uniref:SurA-like protein n=1 Tax=Rhodovulum adriaticum TaxID=35804 RepID=A0A4V2SLF1_RHOAD|nr:SurA N-terminal domain-containing protein [Rhodovulum adriaticum]TCP23116.1 SurA-like protein [Rhodovulum adriaticum]
MMRMTVWLAAAGMALWATGTAAQQGGPFAPRLIVNESAVTNFEIDQRLRFLTILGAPAEMRNNVLQILTDERLQMQAAKRLGVMPEEEAVRSGMEEFAARANMTPEQLVTALGQQGIAPETFRDFVASGIAWRQVVRSRFGPRLQITEAEIDRAIARAAEGGPRTVAVEYALFTMPGKTRADAERVRARVDTCDDLFGEALDAPQDRLIRETRAVADLPADIAGQIGRLDAGESTLALSTPQAAVLLMVCGRTPALGDAEVDRGQIRQQLQNQRLVSYADSYLAELRADAIIREP